MGKKGFVKNYMAENNNFPVFGVKTSVSILVGGVANENARCGARCKLVRGGRGEVRVTQTTKDAEVVVSGSFVVKAFMGGFVM